MSVFTHRGVTITLDASGKFCAECAGKRIRAPSLTAAKTAIDKIEEFKPFKILLGRRDGLQERNVIGLHRNPAKYSGCDYLWLDERGDTHTHVTPSTPENRALLEQCDAAWSAEDKRHTAERDRISELRATIPSISVPKVKPDA